VNQELLLEFPGIPGDVNSWKQRLVAALTPTFNAE
jgi:hypothetical protein